MVGFSHRIQVRHIVVEKKEVAELLKGTLEDVKNETGRVQMLMRLAEKYSLCDSKNDGGNLGWLELSSDDPRTDAPEPTLKNTDLEKIIREGMRDLTLSRGKIYGPVQTSQGFHILIVAQEFGAENAPGFTGSAL